MVLSFPDLPSQSFILLYQVSTTTTTCVVASNDTELAVTVHYFMKSLWHYKHLSLLSYSYQQMLLSPTNNMLYSLQPVLFSPCKPDTFDHLSPSFWKLQSTLWLSSGSSQYQGLTLQRRRRRSNKRVIFLEKHFWLTAERSRGCVLRLAWFPLMRMLDVQATASGQGDRTHVWSTATCDVFPCPGRRQTLVSEDLVIVVDLPEAIWSVILVTVVASFVYVSFFFLFYFASVLFILNYIS